MLVDQPLVRRTAHRIEDFFAVRSPWQRRLWSVGLSLALQELVEASRAASEGTLSVGAVRWYAHRLHAHVGSDPGVGGTRHLDELRRRLHTDLVADGLDHRALRQIAADVDEYYLERWATALESQSEAYNAERIARAIASHLLDRGFSDNHLHRWLSWICKHDTRIHDLASLVREADAIARRPRKSYTVLVPMLSDFPHSAPEPREWLRAARATAWLDQKRLTHLLDGIRMSGALLLRIRASDPESAVDRAANIVDALTARVAVGTRDTLIPHRGAIVDGETHHFPLRRSRRVEIRALERQGELAGNVYDLPGHAVENALQLASHLDSGPPEIAVAGGWSAVESLMTGPGDEQHVEAADRLATLVAGSWPRAELTTLAWERIESVEDNLTNELRDMPDNQARAERLADAIRSQEPLRFKHPSCHCALKRMEKLYRAPRTVLSDVREYAADAFGGYTATGNLVLHGAQTQAVALSATLRSAAPLVGAGIDHAHLTSEEHPLDLAARAQLALERADESDHPLTRLLE